MEPESRRLKEAFGGCLQVVQEVPEAPMLLFGDPVLFEAIGPSGRVWRSVRISFDGFRRLTRRDLKLYGEAYSAVGRGWHPFVLDLASGTVDGAAYPWPDPGE